MAAADRQAADRPAGGRLWLNGEEVGGADIRLAHLAESYD